MSDELHTASPGYAVGRLARALDAASEHPDPDVRARALVKIEQWQAVLEGISSGRLTVGRRTPVADTPAWVTLEVAHGGFATGRYLAEGPLLEHEAELLEQLPDAIPGETERDRLNAWYLGDEGHEALAAAVCEGRYRIAVPEEGALPVAAWLMANGHEGAALELITTLRPLMHRLRFYPRLQPVPQPEGAMVRVCSVGEIADVVRSTRPQPQVAAMNEALRIWNPLLDRAVALWLETVEGEPPSLRQRPDGGTEVVGGWPCQRWPADWAERRGAWLRDLEQAEDTHALCGKHERGKSNLARLADALRRCPTDSSGLTGRDVGWIRRALANTLTRRGALGSEARTRLRRIQAEVAARPSNVELAAIVAARLDAYPAEGGLPSLDPVRAEVSEAESDVVPVGTPIPPHLVAKAARALEAPIAELVELGVIGSSEVLAIVLPQITSQVAAASIPQPELRALYGQIYAAFRRRRSLLLLNLEHQVQLSELPWIAALAPLRADDLDTRDQARQTLEEVTLLAIASFPQTILPNPLVRELSALVRDAGLELPLVEEVAADIFMGTFTTKWARSAQVACEILEGTLYARYYDLPRASAVAMPEGGGTKRWGKETAEAFADLCRQRAQEAHTGEGGSWVAGNGAVIEQSQILTTQNLAALAHALQLTDILRGLAPELVMSTLRWIVRRQNQSLGHFKSRLQMVKNTAYAWRQAIWLLSLCSEEAQRQALAELQELVAEQPQAWAERFAPAVAGLQLVIEGGRFDTTGRGAGDARRFLGWSVGRHWLL